MVRYSKDLLARAAKVKLLLMDVDGVLTDGRIYYLPGRSRTPIESKAFHSRDGAGIRLFHLAGFKTGFITGRESSVVQFRARELGVHYVRQGVGKKGTVFNVILKAARLKPNQACFIGDDIVDLPILRKAGLAVAVANCHSTLKRQVHYVTQAPGGGGAVREIVELILHSKNLLKELSEKIASNKSSLVG